jgi:hypothetical protein
MQLNLAVLILVLVEVAPRVQITNFLKLNDMVLILVLVEVAPRVNAENKERFIDAGLNPCFSGSCAASANY